MTRRVTTTTTEEAVGLVEMTEVDGVLYRPEDVPTVRRTTTVEVEDEADTPADTRAETKVRTPAAARTRTR